MKFVARWVLLHFWVVALWGLSPIMGLPHMEFGTLSALELIADNEPGRPLLSFFVKYQ